MRITEEKRLNEELAEKFVFIDKSKLLMGLMQDERFSHFEVIRHRYWETYLGNLMFYSHGYGGFSPQCNASKGVMDRTKFENTEIVYMDYVIVPASVRSHQPADVFLSLATSHKELF